MHYQSSPVATLKKRIRSRFVLSALRSHFIHYKSKQEVGMPTEISVKLLCRPANPWSDPCFPEPTIPPRLEGLNCFRKMNMEQCKSSQNRGWAMQVWTEGMLYWLVGPPIVRHFNVTNFRQWNDSNILFYWGCSSWLWIRPVTHRLICYTRKLLAEWL